MVDLARYLLLRGNNFLELLNRNNLLVGGMPYRPRRPATSKIIFLSCEGAVTEHEYFELISDIFSEVKSKIQFIDIMEDILKIPERHRTEEQKRKVSKSKPWQLVQKIEEFKVEKNSTYDFEKHLDDEFWIISDVDDHTNEENVEKWNEMIQLCEDKGYGYAISNPFFEIWLLLHHVDVCEKDFKYAVTSEHPYEKNSHYRERIRHDGQAPLHKQKHIKKEHYTKEKVELAIERARRLHKDGDKWPSDLGTTVYLLLEKIQQL